MRSYRRDCRTADTDVKEWVAWARVLTCPWRIRCTRHRGSAPPSTTPLTHATRRIGQFGLQSAAITSMIGRAMSERDLNPHIRRIGEEIFERAHAAEPSVIRPD